MKWAFVQDGKVFELTEIDPAGRFHPAMPWHPCGDEVVAGYIYQNGIFSPPPAPTAEQVVKQYETAIQSKLDAAAIAAGYDDIKNAVTYAEEPAVPKFQADGQAFRRWRSLVWEYAYDQLAAVQAGQREQPTVEEFLAELPVLEHPV